jgi:hypothetical protein
MKQFTIALALSVSLSNPASAGTMRAWVEFIYPSMNTALIDTLEFYTTEGFVLIGVGANYAAYSYKAERLTEQQIANQRLVENDADLVITYESCPPNTGWLSGDISYASVAMEIDTGEELALEIRELLEFTESRNLKSWGFGVSKNRMDQSYFGWNDSDGNSLEMQINENIHQIKFQIRKECEIEE